MAAFLFGLLHETPLTMSPGTERDEGGRESSPLFTPSYFLFLFSYLIVVGDGHTWRSEENFWELVLTSYLTQAGSLLCLLCSLLQASQQGFAFDLLLLFHSVEVTKHSDQGKLREGECLFPLTVFLLTVFQLAVFPLTVFSHTMFPIQCFCL